MASILIINTGSSSLKAALYDAGRGMSLRLDAEVERVGRPDARIRIADTAGQRVQEGTVDVREHSAALRMILDLLRQRGDLEDLTAAGHRVVYGGSEHVQPERVDAEMVRDLRAMVPLDPDHLPQAIAAIEAVSRSYPNLLQVACFDTAFHQARPAVARQLPLPRHYGAEGVVRYGFHGLSYEYIVSELRRIDLRVAEGRLIVAHLGSGASMAAVHQGQSVETTMGFTPIGGLMMSTRTGDLDPGVLLYLVQLDGMSHEALSRLVNKESGLLGVSGSSGDMENLLQHEAQDRRAAEAVELFCYTAKKYLGTLATVLGGVDTLVFTAGIGEHAPAVRERVCSGLAFLGIEVDAERNARNAPVISPDGSAVTVRVMRTDEDLMVARHTLAVLEAGA